MKISDVLFSAAQHRAIKNGACWAIAKVTKPRVIYLPHATSEAMTYFRKLMRPDFADSYWWSIGDYEVRKIALLLAAEVAKSEGL